jgi:hypothetical protein
MVEGGDRVTITFPGLKITVDQAADGTYEIIVAGQIVNGYGGGSVMTVWARPSETAVALMDLNEGRRS